ncbi:IS30 family transposase, partial [Micromonospora sp. DT81.3]|uniref:IS30 family transposase n=1 Tax=Micromonospora sp. DT81.3 TaxID=3416523 RepID=UPI003CEC51A7
LSHTRCPRVTETLRQLDPGLTNNVRSRRAAGRPEPYPLPEGDRNATPARSRSHQQRKEGDLIVGPHHRSAIGTIVERQTRYVNLLHLSALTSSELHAVLVRVLGELPRPLRRTLTWDQGTEMARHLDVTADTGTKIHFCDAASPWQRGTNENTNGLLRQYFPKSTNFAVHSPRDLARVEDELNRRPRLTLGDRTPAELFGRLLHSQNPPTLR